MEATVNSPKQFDRQVLADLPDEVGEISGLGEGLRVVRRSTEELTHELCYAILNMKEFSGDRPLDNAHVVELLNHMQRGTFLPEQVQIIVCTLDGVIYRMNGQHTAWARLEMPKDYKCPIQMLRYRAETENDMRRLYASIDRLKGRSVRNVVVSYLYDTTEWKGYSQATLSKLAEGLAFWLWATKHKRGLNDGDARSYLLLTDYYKLGLKVAGFLESSKGVINAHVRRRPIIAAMFATFEKDAAMSVDFWTAVRDGVGIGSKTDPRLVLRNTVTMTSIDHGGGSTPEKKSASAEEVYRWCIQAWNAYRRGDQIKRLTVNLESDRPKVH